MNADDATRELLSKYAERSAPDAEQRARAWAAISLATGAAGPRSASTSLAKAALVGGMAIAIGGSAAWLFERGGDAPISVAARSQASIRSEDPSDRISTATPSSVPAETTSDRAPLAAIEPAAPPVARERATGARAAEAVAPQAAPSIAETTPAPTEVEPSGLPSGTLAEELALLQSARSMLARDDTAGALAAVDRHAAEFPAGALASEREIVRVTALCAAGRDAEARRAASAADQSPAMARALSRCGPR